MSPWLVSLRSHAGERYAATSTKYGTVSTATAGPSLVHETTNHTAAAAIAAGALTGTRSRLRYSSAEDMKIAISITPSPSDAKRLTTLPTPGRPPPKLKASTASNPAPTTAGSQRTSS